MSTPNNDTTDDQKDLFRRSQVIPKRKREFIIVGNKIAYATQDALVSFISESCCDNVTREAFVFTFRCYTEQNVVLQKFLEIYQANPKQHETIIDIMIQYISKVMTISDKTTLDLMNTLIKLHHIEDPAKADYLEALLSKSQTQIFIPPTTADTTLSQQMFDLDYLRQQKVFEPSKSPQPKFGEIPPSKSPNLQKQSIVIGQKPILVDNPSAVKKVSDDLQQPTSRVQTSYFGNVNLSQTVAYPKTDRSNVRTKLPQTLPIYLSELDFINIPAKVFAQQITLIEFNKFIAIPISELYFWDSSQRENSSPNIMDFLEHNKKMSHWYIQLLLLSPKSRRLQVLRRLIEVGVRMNDLNNWSGLVEVTTALDAFPVYRLQKLFLQLDENDIENLRRIKEMGSMDELLMNDNGIIPGACVPFIQKYLKKFVDINKMMRPSIMANDFTLINVEKCRALSKYIIDWIQCTKYPYPFGCNTIIQDWIYNCLECVKCEERIEAGWSLKIERKKLNESGEKVCDINLLEYSTEDMVFPNRVQVGVGLTIYKLMNFLNTSGIFVLLPTPKKPQGMILSIDDTIGNIILKTQNYMTEDSMYGIVKEIVEIKVVLASHEKPTDIFRLKRIWVDPTQSVVQNIIWIKHVLGIEDTFEGEFYDEKYLFLWREDIFSQFQVLSPFSKNVFKTDGVLMLVPARNVVAPIDLDNSAERFEVTMGVLEGIESDNKTKMTCYTMVMRNSLLYFYSQKDTHVIALGYYKVKVIYDVKRDENLILLVECSDSSEMNGVIIILDKSKVKEATFSTLDLAEKLSQFCVSSQGKRCIGVALENLGGNGIPRIYDELLNCVFTTEDLAMSDSYFDITYAPKKFMEGMLKIEDGVIPADPI
ncbi:Ras guanine nucleotide exchange factor, putative, partial [Entamoeba invadens IP1]|uniref:Ras guanine nucleotide exchange factor, putative n=1 Tax=Entamoeba invadens IP1 TaxID=370355 RepID=UPI0002C3E378